MNIKIALFATIALLGCTTIQATGTNDVSQAITAAKAAQKKADALEGAWTTTDTLIKKAEQAAAKGDNKKALQLAKKAEHEAKLAQAQAEHEQKHWTPPPYLLPKK
ncbi:MAG: SoxXA-binding protein [Pseudomonadota bacterium]